jgi:hypothetical protein
VRSLACVNKHYGETFSELFAYLIAGIQDSRLELPARDDFITFCEPWRLDAHGPLPAAFFRALQRFGTQEAGAGLEMLFDKLWLNSDTRMSGADHVRTFLALVSNAGDKLGVLRMLRDRFGRPWFFSEEWKASAVTQTIEAVEVARLAGELSKEDYKSLKKDLEKLIRPAERSIFGLRMRSRRF